MPVLHCVLLCWLLCAADVKDTWEAGPPAFKTEQEEFQPSVRFEEKKVVLENRGILVSKKSFPEGAVFTATWRWISGEEQGKYQDHLCVVFATDGKQRAWPAEIEAGLVVRFNPASGSVGIEKHEKGSKDNALLAFKDGLKFERNTGYKLRIVHSPKGVEVNVDGKKIVSAEVVMKGDKVAGYDREPVAGIKKKSELEEPDVVPFKS